MRKTVKQGRLPLILEIATVVLLIGGSIFTNVFLFNKIEENNEKIRTLTNKLDNESVAIKESNEEIKKSLKEGNTEIKDLIAKLNNKLVSTTNNINSKLDKVNSTLVDLNTLVNSLPNTTQLNTIDNKVTDLQTDVNEFVLSESTRELDSAIESFTDAFYNMYSSVSSSGDLTSEERTLVLNMSVEFKRALTPIINKLRAINSDNYILYIQTLALCKDKLTSTLNLDVFGDKANYIEITTAYNNINSILATINEEIDRIN